MPFIRRTLSRRAQRSYQDQLRWFAQAGLEIEPSSDEAVLPAVDVTIGFGENSLNVIYEHTIWVVVITRVRLVAREPGIRLSDEVFLDLPWEQDLSFDFLPMERTGEYRIGHQWFEQALVVNHLLLDTPLTVGKPLEGLLILQGCGVKLPTTYQAGDSVHVVAKLADTLDTFYSAEGTLTVNPSSHSAPKVIRRHRSSLFDSDFYDSPRIQQSTRSASQPEGSVLTPVQRAGT